MTRGQPAFILAEQLHHPLFVLEASTGVLGTWAVAGPAFATAKKGAQ
jgi:hypothetical protein